MSASTPAPASAPAPAPAAPTSSAPAPAAAPAAPPAGEAPPADGLSLAALAKQIEEMRSLLTQTAEAKEAAAKQAERATSEKATIEQQLGQFKEMWRADKGSGALAEAARQVQYASPLHAENALQVFKGAYRIEVRDSGDVVAIGADGKAQPVRAAYAAWAASPAGAMFRAANVQPGAGAPAPLAPEVGQKMPKDMSPEEFAAFMQKGFTGKLTADARSPTITLKTNVNPYAARREEMRAQAIGGTPKK